MQWNSGSFYRLSRKSLGGVRCSALLSTHSMKAGTYQGEHLDLSSGPDHGWTGADAGSQHDGLLTAGPLATPIDDMAAAPRRTRTKRHINRRRTVLLTALCGLITASCVTAVLVMRHDKSSSDSYTVTTGSVGAPVVVTLPRQIGPWKLLMPADVAPWSDHPNLRPAGQIPTYGTVSGLYAGANPTDVAISVDSIYAQGDTGHRAIFSAAPQTLADLITSTLYIPDAQHYPAGDPNTVLECGTYGSQPLCYWADHSTIGFIAYSGGSGPIEWLAALTATYRAALVHS